jgi:hypothetical protein
MNGSSWRLVHGHRDAPDFGTRPLPHPDQAGLLDLSPSLARAVHLLRKMLVSFFVRRVNGLQLSRVSPQSAI